MKRTLCAVGLGALCVTWVTAAAAQVPDHLKCYKIKDPQAKATYTANLGGLVAEPGCKITVPAQMACVPAAKTNVTPTPPGGGGTGVPNSFFCYKVKCQKATLPTLAGQDQFGNRTVTPSAAKLLCAPLAGPTTTTTMTSTSTTTTLIPLCPSTASAGDPCGSCGIGTCQPLCQHTCPGPLLACMAPAGRTCPNGADSDCPAGWYCETTTSFTCGTCSPPRGGNLSCAAPCP
jgi:hypothetical protein